MILYFIIMKENNVEQKYKCTFKKQYYDMLIAHLCYNF